MYIYIFARVTERLAYVKLSLYAFTKHEGCHTLHVLVPVFISDCYLSAAGCKVVRLESKRTAYTAID
jgi:hypothetical protein